MKDLYSLENIKKIRWGVLEENQPISLYPVMYPGWSGVIGQTGKILGKPQKNIINLWRKDNQIIFVDHREWTDLGSFALKKIINNPKWGAKLNQKILKLADELVNFSAKKIFSADLKTKTDLELYLLYKKYLDKHSNLYNYAIIPVYLDLYKPHLTTYLTEYLNQRVEKVKYSISGKECFALLTIPQELSKVQEEEKELLVLASKPSNKDLLKRHITRFKYIGYNWEGPAFPDSYFIKRLNEYRKDNIKPKIKLGLLISEKEKVRINQELLLRNLKIDKKHQKLLEITRGFIYSKDYRKMSLVQSYFEVEPLLKEMARRFNLSLTEIRNCLLTEVHDMALGKLKRSVDLDARKKGCLFVVVNQSLPGRVFVDNRLRAIRHYLLKKEDLKAVNYFHGQPACLGKARGRVKIITTIKDLKKMKKGDIMVSQMTNPDLVPAMKIAGAIVTDLGGITSHAAIVSRELKVPCVIGTKIATKVLKDNDLVEVDANSGDIRKI